MKDPCLPPNCLSYCLKHQNLFTGLRSNTLKHVIYPDFYRSSMPEGAGSRIHESLLV